MRLSTVRKGRAKCAVLLYLLHRKGFIASPSDEYINPDTTAAGSFGRNTFEILMLPGSVVRPIRFFFSLAL
jgi:hypothetical protein